MNVLIPTSNYNIYHYRRWLELGVDTINPPRDACRNIPLLKVLKENGQKIRLLINETCALDCTNFGTCGCNVQTRPCLSNDEMLKRCYVLPRWLDILDEYVDVYKLNTRGRKAISGVFHPLDRYINRKDCMLSELFVYPNEKNAYNISTSEIPDTLLYCDKFNCEECGVCDKLYKKYPVLYGKFKPQLYAETKKRKHQ